MDKVTLKGELHTILSSRAYYMTIEAHKRALTEKLLEYVRKQDWYNAYATVAKIDDLMKINTLLENSLKELDKK